MSLRQRLNDELKQAMKAGEKLKVDPVALERTRESIKMLDDLYKNAVVLITKTYVEQQADTPAEFLEG